MSAIRNRYCLSVFLRAGACCLLMAFFSGRVQAQQKITASPDSAVKVANAAANRLKGNVANVGKTLTQNVKGTDSLLKNTIKRVQTGKDSLQSITRKKVAEKQAELEKRLSMISRAKISYQVGTELQSLYQPVMLPGAQKWINIAGLSASVQAFGVPFNLRFTSSQAMTNGFGFQERALFKADFNPTQFQQIFKADLQQYTAFKDHMLSGYELSDYLRDRVVAPAVANLNASKPGMYNYFNNPSQWTGLLTSNREALRAQVLLLLDKGIPDTLKAAVAELRQARSSQSITSLAHRKAESKLRERLNQDSLAFVKLLSGNLNTDSVRAKIIAKLELRAAGATDSVTRDSLHKAIARVKEAKQLTDLKSQAMAGLKFTEDTAMLSDLQAGYQKFQALKNLKGKKLDEVLRIEQLQGIQADSVTAVITDLKLQLSKKGLDMNRVMLLEQFLSSGKISSASVSTLLSQYPDSKFQGMMTRVNDFKVGNYANRLPAGIQNSDRMVNGLHLTYRLGRMPLTFGYGSLNDINSAKDAAYTNSIYVVPQQTTYISALINKNYSGSTRVSVISGFSGKFNDLRFQTPTLPSNSVAMTLTRTFEMGRAGSIALDVSKSATLYARNYQPGSEAILEHKAGYAQDVGSSVFEALAVGFTHHADITEAGVTENFYFNYAGMGYQNPAATGFTGGKRKIGGNLKKSMFGNKLTLGFRTDLRDMPLSYTTSDKWRNYQYQVDSRYRLSRKTQLSMSYLATGTNKQIEQSVSNVYSSQKLQFDINHSFRLARYPTVAHLSVGNQQLINRYLSPIDSRILTFNYLQSTVFPKSSLTATVFYNKELSVAKLIGDLLNADLTYQYILFSKVNFSTALTGLSNTGIAKQAGIRQGIQFAHSKRWDLNSYVDLRKNLITPLYPDLYASCRAEIQFRYRFDTIKLDQ